MQVLLQRQSDDRAVGSARDDHAHLGGQCQALLQHAGHPAQLGPGRGQGGAVGHPQLALAVVAQAGGLEDAGQQGVGDCGEVGLAGDHRMGGTGHAAGAEVGLLGGTVLANRHRVAAGGDRSALGQPAQGLGGHVLEFGGDGVGLVGQPGQAGGVEVGGGQVQVGHPSGRAAAVRVQHRGAETQRLRGVHEHAAELATAHHAERDGTRGIGRGAVSGEQHSGHGARVSSVMARAASV